MSDGNTTEVEVGKIPVPENVSAGDFFRHLLGVASGEGSTQTSRSEPEREPSAAEVEAAKAAGRQAYKDGCESNCNPHIRGRLGEQSLKLSAAWNHGFHQASVEYSKRFRSTHGPHLQDMTLREKFASELMSMLVMRKQKEDDYGDGGGDGVSDEDIEKAADVAIRAADELVRRLDRSQLVD